MAMNRGPFTVDDSTDEDFFNQLVNDDEDVDFKVSTPFSASGAPVLTDGNEFDEAKAFANLSINELDENDEVKFGNTSDEIGVDESNANMEMTEHVNQVGKVGERGNSLVSSSSFEFDKVIQNPENEGDNGGDAFGNIAGDTSKNGLDDDTGNALHGSSYVDNSSNYGHYSEGYNDVDPTEITTSWNQASVGNNGYPSHMMFDSKYLGWYYDTIAQNWFTLESYAVSAPSIGQGEEQMNLGG
ncbi:hypothetical protein OROGR_026682 [Orobanche gracilis]